MNKFIDLPIQEQLKAGIAKKNYETMTEVQMYVIPPALNNKDIMAQAPTGTGKTMAFAIPILNNLSYGNNAVEALILAPTRELAVQISKEIKEVAVSLSEVRIATLYGGELIDKQITALKKKPQIVVATPGRLMDHMRRRTLNLNDIKVLVLDEADEMLNMGFREDIDEILKSVTSTHQTMLFSATITGGIETIAKTYLNKPEVVRINRKELTVSTITQKYIDVQSQDKTEIISRLIDTYGYELVMVFCNTKRMVDEVTSNLLMRGFIVEALHGDMKQMQRDRVMSRFRSRAINILVASDVAARGLDIDDVDVVFNYDVPTDEEYYVHRIGRTGRAQKEGLAITLVTKKEKYALRDIISYSQANITKMEIPSYEKVIKIRLERLIEQAKEATNPNLKKIVEQVLSEQQETNFDPYQLISGLIMMQLNIGSGEDLVAEVTPKNKTTRLYIGLGKKDKLQVSDFVKTLLNKTTLTNRDINNIDMHDNFTFCDVPAHLVDEVAMAFIKDDKGRKIVVEEVREKKGSSRVKKSDKSESLNPERKKRTPKPSVNDNYNSSKEYSKGKKNKVTKKSDFPRKDYKKKGNR